LGDGGRVCVFTSVAADYLIDVAGAFPAGSGFDALSPARLLDTRVPGATIDGSFVSTGPIPAGGVLAVDVVGRGGVPAGAGAVALNVTVVNPVEAGFATVFPCVGGGGVPPDASNLNFVAGQAIPNAVVSKVGDGGRVCVFTSVAADYLIDVAGAFRS
jgi:hypothetical protein